MSTAKTITCQFGVPQDQAPFDFVRVDDAAKALGVSQDTLRDWNKIGLKFYHMGRPAFVSKSETNEFIRTKATVKTGQQEEEQK